MKWEQDILNHTYKLQFIMFIHNKNSVSVITSMLIYLFTQYGFMFAKCQLV
jgi:hypothetical protein